LNTSSGMGAHVTACCTIITYTITYYDEVESMVTH